MLLPFARSKGGLVLPASKTQFNNMDLRAMQVYKSNGGWTEGEARADVWDH